MKYISTTNDAAFVDTSGWISILKPGEKHHLQFARTFTQLLKHKVKIYTSDLVLSESWTRLMTNDKYSDAEKLRKMILQAEKNREMTVVYSDREAFDKYWLDFSKFADLKLSFVDASVITLARILKVTRIISLDHGFIKAGLTLHPDLDRP